MARRAVQKAIEDVRFNIVSKVKASDVQRILKEQDYHFPQVLSENETVKTHLNYVFQVKSISPENGVYVRDNTSFEISFTRRKLPFSFLMAVDKSFSMKKQFSEELSKVDVVYQELAEFLESNVGTQNKVGCVSFGLDWELLFEPQPIENDDLNLFKKKLQSISNTGRATPSAAMSATREIFEGKDEDFLKRLVIFSDGVDKLGQHPLEVVEELESEGIITDVIFVGKEDDEESLRILREITNVTRGQLVVAHDQHAIEDFLKEITQSVVIPLMSSRRAEEPKEETVSSFSEETEQITKEVQALEGKIGQKDENINKEDRISSSEIVPTGSEEPETDRAAEEDEPLGVSEVAEEGPSEEVLEEEDISDVIVIGSEVSDEESEDEDSPRHRKRFHQTPSLFEWLKTQFLKLKKFFWDTD